MDEKLKDEVAKKFPGEKIRSISGVLIKPMPPKEGLKFERQSYSMESGGKLVLTEKHIVLAADRRNYDMIMAVVAFVFLVGGIAVLLQGVNIGMAVTLVLGFVLFIAIEGFLFMQKARSPLTSFERAGAEVEKKGNVLIVGGKAKSGFDWMAEEMRFEIRAAEGETLPAL